MPAKAVSDDATAVFHANGLQEVFKVLTVLLRDKGPQTCQNMTQSDISGELGTLTPYKLCPGARYN